MELIYFILGILFIQYFIPLVEGISAWFLTWVEMKKTKCGEIINQSNINMRQAAASAEEDTPCRTIGFYAPDDDTEKEEDEDEI